MKKVISLFLACLMLFTVVLPVLAAEDERVLGDPEHYAELAAVDYTNRVYYTPEQKLEEMTRVTENERYALYIQEYTAEVCVVDKETHQFLFTNPYDVADTQSSVLSKHELLSQVTLSFYGGDGLNDTFNSYEDAVLADGVVIKAIRNGVRVEYTIGQSNKKQTLPYQIEKSRFEELILEPMYLADRPEGVTLSFEEYLTLRRSSNREDQKKADAAEGFNFGKFFTFYTLLDLSDPKLTVREKSTYRAKYPITETMPIYVLDADSNATEKNTLEKSILQFTEYTIQDMLYDHELVEYEMEDRSPPVFRLALEYTLEEDGFQVRLPARGISYDAATYTLDMIQVLPFMGAGRVSAKEDACRVDDGYNFIPDGSGAIVDFRQNVNNTKISGTLYGGDFGFYNGVSTSTASYQTWRAPVYGTVFNSTRIKTEYKMTENGEIQRDENGKYVYENFERDSKGNLSPNGEFEYVSRREGYVAFMTEGDSLTRIDSVNGGPIHDYHATSLSFYARQQDSYPLDGITVSGEAAVYTKSIERKYVGNYTIKVKLLCDDSADYVGMAKAYRSYLIREGVLEALPEAEDDIDLYLDIIGDIDTTRKILGVPTTTKAALTTFEQAKTILAELKEAGVSDQVIRYLGWMNGGMESTAPTTIKVEKALGGEQGLKDLVAYVQSEGNEIFMDIDFAYVKSLGMFDGFDEGEDAAKTIDGKTAYLKTYNPIIQAFNTQVAVVISAKSMRDFYSSITEKYSSFFGEGSKNISVGSLGYALNSSQDENFPLNREDAKDYTKSVLDQIAAEYDHVMVENGNYYTWSAADTILNIPLDSSNRHTATAEVPFLGIVLHGYINYTGEALNLSGDYEYTILKTIENGANPYFIVAYDNIGELKINKYTAYYAVEYGTWKDKIVEDYLRLNEVLKSLQNTVITEHEILDNRVVKVSYENGTSIYLNYNSFEVFVAAEGLEETQKIPAMGYYVANV